MMARTKHWYWEAEQDRIAADPALRLLSLECVGLFFLLMNEMWRSVRVGYLCDPVQQDVPLSDTELAAILGRDSAVVQRVLRVLLERDIFSKEKASGIIYCRGILRKENLRKKRASAGRKGGLRSHDLLKQTVEQNTEQSVRIGIGIGIVQKPTCSVSEPDEISWLARHAAIVQKVGGNRVMEDHWISNLTGLVAAGWTLEKLRAEVDRQGRDISEPPWRFKERLVGSKQDGADMFGSLKRFVERGNG